jgi:hypothetical protein
MHCSEGLSRLVADCRCFSKKRHQEFRMRRRGTTTGMFASSMEKSKPAIRYDALRDSTTSFKFYAISTGRLSNDARSESKCRRQHFHHWSSEESHLHMHTTVHGRYPLISALNASSIIFFSRTKHRLTSNVT